MKFQITASEGNQKVRWYTKAANIGAGLARARKEAKGLLKKDIDKLDSIEVYQVDKDTAEDHPGQTVIPGTEDERPTQIGGTKFYRPPRMLPAPGRARKTAGAANHGN